MEEGRDMLLDTGDPVAVAAVAAIHAGDVAELERLLHGHPGLAAARLGTEGRTGMTRTLLHVVTDWPGHFPNGAITVAVLVGAGADVNARFTGPHTETPLHWAASSDDVEVLDALLDAGADIEARGAVIGGGTALSDATAFAQWAAARRLLEFGAQPTFWESATMGLMDRVEAAFAADPSPSTEDVTEAFWGACHGGQLATARYLLARGADSNWNGWDDKTAFDAATSNGFDDVAQWVRSIGGQPHQAGV
jgi:uncharacterized protein